MAKEPVKLNSYSTITNISLFLESYFATVRTNNCKRTVFPFLIRLQELKQQLISTVCSMKIKNVEAVKDLLNTENEH
jgi:hypothetical protein